MSVKISKKEIEDKELKNELKEIKSIKGKFKDNRLIEITRHFASRGQWDLAIDAFHLISNEKTRDLLIADLIENFILPEQDIALAKKLCKYLTPSLEIEPLIRMRIALSDNDSEKAMTIADSLPSPFSRNFAFVHIMESFICNKEKSKQNALRKRMIENIKTIYDHKSRSYLLRDLAINLFLASNEKEQAKELVALIPDETIRTQVLNKINAKK